MSLSIFADETSKCRKETFFYDIEGRTSSNEFFFINNFMIYPCDGYYRFKSKDLIEIFAQTDWYSPAENFKENFNPLDLCLVEVIKLAEQ